MSGISTLYTLQDIELLDTLNKKNDSEKPSINFELFLISHSGNINWSSKTYSKRTHMSEILLNLSYYSYPKIFKKLNNFINSEQTLISTQIYRTKYSIFKYHILQKIKELYKLTTCDLKYIVLAPLISSSTEHKIGVFILNNYNIITKITKHLEKETYTFLSSLLSRQQNKLSLLNNIKFQKKVSETIINYNHYNHNIKIKDSSIPLPIMVNNIAGYFPCLEIVEVKPLSLSITTK
jgi:hypothetical protein